MKLPNLVLNARMPVLTVLISFFLGISPFETAWSQDLPQIVPLSPNAASIAKYGEVPVGHFTGVPSISIPIHTISSGELTLPISLSYHAGGNKVESISTWAGLGWSLGTIPSITRSVRGIPDEVGYFSNYSDYTVEQLWDMRFQNTQLFGAFRSDLYSGSADSEPDIFYYSLPGENGKFFYNQEEGEFITYPRTNTKIVWDDPGFTITAPDGVTYNFNVIETTTSNGASQGSPVRSAWYASEMASASKKDVINFTYSFERQISKTKSVVTKYHFLSGVSNGSPSDSGSILSTVTTDAYVPDSIVFDRGYIKFNKDMAEYRKDLHGGYSLKDISIYNKHNQLIDKYALTQRFKTGNGHSGGGSACYNADSYSRKWMLLDKIEQVSTIDPNDKLAHSFTYNETYFPACRYSAGQDYWGFYNGRDINQDLTPSYYLPNSTTQIAGADRGVDPDRSKYGILKRIDYPTGGYTLFEYENHDASAGDLPPQYISRQQIVSGDEFIDPGENLDGTDSYSKTFTLNNPPDAQLNNGNANGGAYVDFEFQFPGCDLSSGNANNCARFTVNGPSINTTDITYYGNTLYLPNGTYTMTATFNQVGNPQYHDFIFIADWQEIDPNQDHNAYSGGLRIEEIKSYPGSSLSPVIKKFEYTKVYGQAESSGDVFSNPNYSHTDIIEYHSGNNSQGGYNTSLQLRVRSTSNVQQVTHSGSYVGYSSVFEKSDDPNKTGYRSYYFTTARDEPHDYGFPYPPDQSFELDRGRLVKQEDFEKSATGFDVVRTKEVTHTSTAFDQSTAYPKSSFAIKWGNLVISDVVVSTMLAQTLSPYSVYGGWKATNRETVTEHLDNGDHSLSTTNKYDNGHHLLITGTVTTSSDGKSMISSIKYPQDMPSPSSAEQNMIAQNRLGEAIETKVYKDSNGNGTTEVGELLSTQSNSQKVWYTDVIAPQFIKTAKADADPENRIVFHSYYSNGRAREVSRADGTRIVYIWGYEEQYPLAKIENANYSLVSGHVSNLQSLSDADNDRTMGYSGSEGALRQALDNLRNQSSLSDAMVTTYTYDPLIGVTSITDPRGQTVYYDYDGLNRLERVIDLDGNVLSENQYNYANQD